MTTLAILQARMTSTRMPGKVLAPLAGRPSILRQIERIQRASRLDGIVVATSSDSSDDVLVEVLEAEGIAVVRGPMDDVLARFILAMDEHQPTAVVRLTADCPLTSPVVIDEVIEHFWATGADYASNTMKPTYPDGLDVEVVKAQVLREVAAESTDPPEREHVTLGVYRRHDRYRIENVVGKQDLSDLRWTVDTPEDYRFVSEVYDALYEASPGFDIDEILDYLRQHPGRSRTVQDAARNAALKGLPAGAMESP